MTQRERIVWRLLVGLGVLSLSCLGMSPNGVAENAEESQLPKREVSDSPGYVPGSVIIKLKEGATFDDLLSLNQQFGVKHSEPLWPARPSPEDALEQMRKERSALQARRHSGWYWWSDKSSEEAKEYQARVEAELKELDKQIALKEEHIAALEERRKLARPDAEDPHLERLFILEVSESVSVPELVRSYQAHPGVEYAAPNRIYQPSADPNDRLHTVRIPRGNSRFPNGYPLLYALQPDYLNPQRAWDKTRGAGVTVAMIDSGVDYSHPDLAGNIYINPGEDGNHNGRRDAADFNGVDDDRNGLVDDVTGYDFVENDSDPMPVSADYHGTHVAGIIAARGNNPGVNTWTTPNNFQSTDMVGVAYEARLLPIRGTGSFPSLTEALRYAMDNPDVKVINNSWGTDERYAGPYPEMQDIILEAIRRGIVVVFSAGNQNDDTSFYFPKNMPEVLVVAATTDAGIRRSNSNYGPGVDLAAPGTNIVSTVPLGAKITRMIGGQDVECTTINGTSIHFNPATPTSYYLGSGGTSFSAPYVSGALALLRAFYPTLTSEQLATRVIRTATPFAQTPDQLIGSGILHVSNALLAPVFDPVPAGLPIPIREGETLRFRVRVTAPAESRLTFSAAAGLPSGAAFSSVGSQEAELYWVPSYTQAGRYPIRLAVSDGTLSDSQPLEIEVREVTNPPVFFLTQTRLSATEGQAFSFTVRAEDPEGDATALSASGLPAGAQFQAAGSSPRGTAEGTLTWTPDDAQGRAAPYTVTLHAFDGRAAAVQPVDITAVNVNRPPMLGAIEDKSVNENELLTFTLSATDPDGEALTYQAASLPTGAQLTLAGVFSWRPSSTQGRSTPYPVTLTARDLAGLASASRTVQIMVNNVNQPPTLNPISVQTVDEGSPWVITVSATDIDGDALMYSAEVPLPAGAVFDTSAQTLRWTPSYTQAGSYSVRFTVTDGAASDSETASITVRNVNGPPVLALIGNRVVNENDLLTFTVSATDPDGERVSFSRMIAVGGSRVPSGVRFSTSTRVFSWTPTFLQAGTYHFIFQANDPGRRADTETVEIIVQNVNRPPTLARIRSPRARVNRVLTITVSGSDPDGTSGLVYGATPLPAGAQFDPSTRRFTWQPTATQKGAHVVKFSVTDGAATAEQNVTIQVNP